MTGAEIIAAYRKESEADVPIWTKSKWKKDQLRNKTVEFNLLPAETKNRETGIGYFDPSENPDGKLFIQIVHNRGASGNFYSSVHYYLTQAAVDLIREHPD